jgi:hypothetical protein
VSDAPDRYKAAMTRKRLLVVVAVGIVGLAASLAVAAVGRQPAVSGFAFDPSRFSVAERATTIRFHLARPAARVRITVGREVTRRRSVVVGTLTRGRLAAGDRRMAFGGRLRGRGLSPGRYRATLVAVDRRHRQSRPRTTPFTIVRGRTAFPNPSTAGVPAGWTPKHTTHGELTITRPGTVLDGELITGAVHVRARNVTIRNSWVHGPIDNQAFANGAGIDYGGLLVEDTDVGPPSGTSGSQNGAVGVSGYTARRVHIHNVVEGFRVARFNNPAIPPRDETVVIEDSLVQIERGECSHNDGIQGFGEPRRAIIRDNTIDTRHSGPECTTGAIFVGNGNQTLVTAEDNLLLGGGFTLRLGPSGTYDHARGNRIVDRTWGFGPVLVADCGDVRDWADNRVVTADGRYRVTSTVRRLRTCR